MEKFKSKVDNLWLPDFPERGIAKGCVVRLTQNYETFVQKFVSEKKLMVDFPTHKKV